MANILVVDDNYNLRRAMMINLERTGHSVFGAGDGLEALEALDKTVIHLIIVDIMMPNMDGFELTAELRGGNMNIPVLMVTAKEALEDKRKGFSLGADDYMVKPVDMDELLLRVSALLRRSRIAVERKLQVGSTLLDYSGLSVTTDGETVTMPQKEFYLLFHLLSYPNRIFTRQDLMDEIWGYDSESMLRTVDVHVMRLRERFKNNDDFEILTVRGLGYKAVKKQ
jgi:two-component system OmpR family response regulator